MSAGSYSGTRIALDVVILSLVGAAVIHFTQIRTHFEEWIGAGLFFVFVTVVQFALGFLLWRWPRREFVLIAALTSAGLLAVWLLSRTAGMPVGPESGEPEALGRPDVIASVLEAVTIAGSSLLMRRLWVLSRARVELFAGAFAALAMGALTLVAIYPADCEPRGDVVAQDEPSQADPEHEDTNDGPDEEAPHGGNEPLAAGDEAAHRHGTC